MNVSGRRAERVDSRSTRRQSLSGLSKAHLSRLESAERQPSIAALLTLSDALGTPVSALLGEQPDASPLAISTDGAPRHESKGLSIASCSGYAGFVGARGPAHHRRSGPPARRPRPTTGARSGSTCSKGILRLEYDGEVHHLGPGVTAHFDADRPHRLGAEGGAVEVLLVAAKDARNVQNIH